MAQRGVPPTSGLKRTYRQIIAEHIEDLNEYERMETRHARDFINRLDDVDRQALYIKLHWDLMRLSAQKRNKADTNWRRQNKSLLLYCEENDIRDPIAVERIFTENLILKEEWANSGFWFSRVGFHANIIAAEKNARDLLCIDYPGEVLAERRYHQRAASERGDQDHPVSPGLGTPAGQRGPIPRQTVPGDREGRNHTPYPTASGVF